MAKDVANDPFHSQILTKTSENAKNAASQATSMIGGIGFSLFSKVKDFSNQYSQNPTQEQTQPQQQMPEEQNQVEEKKQEQKHEEIETTN